MQGETVWI